jgi:hypothetical protein
VSSLEEIIRKLEGPEDYMIGYKPPPYLRKKMAKVLRSGEFRGISEFFTKVLDDWIRDWEMEVVHEGRGKFE